MFAFTYCTSFPLFEYPFYLFTLSMFAVAAVTLSMYILTLLLWWDFSVTGVYLGNRIDNKRLGFISSITSKCVKKIIIKKSLGLFETLICISCTTDFRRDNCLSLCTFHMTSGKHLLSASSKTNMHSLIWSELRVMGARTHVHTHIHTHKHEGGGLSNWLDWTHLLFLCVHFFPQRWHNADAKIRPWLR